jgi:hypothetical protein
VRLWNGRRIRLIELVNANGSRIQTVMVSLKTRSWLGGSHHCTFIAAVCTLRPASVPIIPTTFDTVRLAAVATIPATLSKLWP